MAVTVSVIPVSAPLAEPDVVHADGTRLEVDETGALLVRDRHARTVAVYAPQAYRYARTDAPAAPGGQVPAGQGG